MPHAALSACAVMSLLLGAVPGAAVEPDTSERFREAMSVCTLPGADPAPRLARLSETGWQATAPSPEDLSALAVAAGLLGEAPPDPETLHRQSSVRLVLEARDGVQTCFLVTPHSADSDLLLSDLEEAGGITELDGVRTGAMASISRDGAAGDWRTEVSLAASSSTLAATFLTREDR